MNDWSNDNLVPGNLVHIWSSARWPPPTGRFQGIGIVISLNKPPPDSLQIYDAQVLIGGTVINVYRQDMYRITDDGDEASLRQPVCKPVPGVV